MELRQIAHYTEQTLNWLHLWKNSLSYVFWPATVQKSSYEPEMCRCVYCIGMWKNVKKKRKTHKQQRDWVKMTKKKKPECKPLNLWRSSATFKEYRTTIHMRKLCSAHCNGSKIAARQNTNRNMCTYNVHSCETEYEMGEWGRRDTETERNRV